MNQDLDTTIGQLLREDSPPAKDPMFRIALVERRERERYRQRLRNRLLMTFLAAALPGLALFVIEQPAMSAFWLTVTVAVTGALVRVAAATQQAIRWVRGGPRSHEIS